MPYLNLDLDYFDHRKTRRLIGLLGRGAEVLPIRLWSYCGKFHCEDGRLSGYSEREIESLAVWWGKTGDMLPAMKSCEFMECESGVWGMHDWQNHQGHLAAFKERAKAGAAKRWENARKNAVSNAKPPNKQYSSEVGLVGKEGKDSGEGGAGEGWERREHFPEVNDGVEPPNPPACGTFYTMLHAEIGKAYKRHPHARWNYEEERLLALISRCEGAEKEWLEILAYQRKDPGYKRRTVLALLQNWQGELDKARGFDAARAVPDSGKPKQTSIVEKDLAKIRRELQ